MDSDELLDKIILFRNVLNGENKQGEKTDAFTNFSRFRYYVILYYCVRSAVQRDMLENKGGFSLPYLKKVAKQLGINFDRSRIGFAVFHEGQDKKEIGLFVGNNSYKYFYITKKGMRYCEKVLKEMTKLKINEVKYITFNDSSLKRLVKILEK
jgi:hypothetical protein